MHIPYFQQSKEFLILGLILVLWAALALIACLVTENPNSLTVLFSSLDDSLNNSAANS